MDAIFKRAAKQLVHKGKRGRLLRNNGRAVSPVYCLIEYAVTDAPGGNETQVTEPRDIATFLVAEVDTIEKGDRFESDDQLLVSIDQVLSRTGYMIKTVINSD